MVRNHSVPAAEPWQKRRQGALGPFGMAGHFIRLAHPERYAAFRHWDIRLVFTDGEAEVVSLGTADRISASLEGIGEIREANLVKAAAMAARALDRQVETA